MENELTFDKGSYQRSPLATYFGLNGSVSDKNIQFTRVLADKLLKHILKVIGNSYLN